MSRYFQCFGVTWFTVNAASCKFLLGKFIWVAYNLHLKMQSTSTIFLTTISSHKSVVNK